MRKGICPKKHGGCGQLKLLGKHSKLGNHQPPYIWMCRDCHDKKHGIKRGQKRGQKIQRGTRNRKKMLKKIKSHGR